MRIFWNPAYLNQKYKRDDFSWMSKNVVLNNFGYRDEDTTLIKSPNVIRIYSLGDSFTFGWYIDDPKLSYPNILEDSLKKSFGEGKIEVINASQPGFKIQDSLERFRSEGVLFSPDIVTLGINLFDLTDKEFPPKKPIFGVLATLRLYEMTFGNLERARVSRLTWEELRETIRKDSKQLRRAQEEIQALNKLVSSNGITLILVIFPNYDPSNPNNPYAYKDFHDRIREIAGEIKVVDLFDPFQSVQDKTQLVLNPTDNHPTILAHSIAAEAIIKEFDFANFVLSHRPVGVVKNIEVSLGDNLVGIKGIVTINGVEAKWVYFDRKLDLGVQKRTLENKGERRFPFMADFIKTAKALTHAGWPGAKIEMHFLGVQEIVVGREVYGYPIVGISQFTVFGRENGATFSRNLDLSELEIMRDAQNVRIKILNEGILDFYRVNFDVAINQVDIDNGSVISFFNTYLKRGVLKKGESKVNIPIFTPYSLPKFVGANSSYSYVWYNNVLQEAKLNLSNSQLEVEFILPAQEDVKIQIPVGQESDISLGPVISYL